jgi:hypothetical protein
LKSILWNISFSSVEKGWREQVNLLTISVVVIGWKYCSCRVLVVGGGAGGCSIAAKYASKLGKNKVIIIDPADVSYINYHTKDYLLECMSTETKFHCNP